MNKILVLTALGLFLVVHVAVVLLIVRLGTARPGAGL
jgi:hypothetical protein